LNRIKLDRILEKPKETVMSSHRYCITEGYPSQHIVSCYQW